MDFHIDFIFPEYFRQNKDAGNHADDHRSQKKEIDERLKNSQKAVSPMKQIKVPSTVQKIMAQEENGEKDSDPHMRFPDQEFAHQQKKKHIQDDIHRKFDNDCFLHPFVIPLSLYIRDGSANR